MPSSSSSSSSSLASSSFNSNLPPHAAIASANAVQAAIIDSVPLINNSLPPQSSLPLSNLDPFPLSLPTHTSLPNSIPSIPHLPDPHQQKSTIEIQPQIDHPQLEPAGILNHQNNDLVTVFSSQTDFNVKHPLYSTWTLWFDNASNVDKAKNWDDIIQRVMEVESVEEFWGLYHNIVPPSLIHVGSNYYLFKDGIKPAWEDEHNQNGGRWSIQVARDKSRDSIDKWWLYTMLAAIGETFETPYTSNGKPPSSMSFTNEVTGVIISSRKMFFRISIWTRSADCKATAENIGRHFKYGVLGMKEGASKKKGVSDHRGIQTDCEFQSHVDSQMKKRGGWTV